MDTPKPHQNAAAQDFASDAVDAPNLAIDDALARILGNPPAAECPIMVLLVDDQAIIAEAIRQALADEPSVDFHYCASPEEALRSAAETRATVILQDLVMPGTDGLTLVRQYRQNPATRDIPIIVLSTKEEPLVKSAAFAAGASFARAAFAAAIASRTRIGAVPPALVRLATDASTLSTS